MLPVPAVLRQQSDVDDPGLRRPPGHIQAPCGLAVDQDHVEGRARVPLGVPLVLRGELLADERILLRVAPRYPSLLM